MDGALAAARRRAAGRRGFDGAAPRFRTSSIIWLRFFGLETAAFPATTPPTAVAAAQVLAAVAASIDAHEGALSLSTAVAVAAVQLLALGIVLATVMGAGVMAVAGVVVGAVVGAVATLLWESAAAMDASLAPWLPSSVVVREPPFGVVAAMV